jgi:hypothetical protein
MKIERRRSNVIVTAFGTGITMLMTGLALTASTAYGQTGFGQCDPITCTGAPPCGAKTCVAGPNCDCMAVAQTCACT